MSKKEVKFGQEGFNKVLRGVNILAKTVSSTLGPGGRNVIFENWGWPLVTKDGVTVARQIELSDKYENVGAQMVKQVANKTCNDAGDGTTTATILANAILEAGYSYRLSNVNPIDIMRGINKAVSVIVDVIEKNIRQNIEDGSEKLEQIATVSANWDKEIGKIVADAVNAVGSNGAVQIEESKSYESYLELIEGIKFDRGFTSPLYINNTAKQIVEMEDPYIFLYKGTIKDLRKLVPLLEQVSKAQKNLIIIADDFDASVTTGLIANKKRGALNVATMKAPWFKDMRLNTMEDLAIYFGTTYFDDTYGRSSLGIKEMEDLCLADLGKCKRAIITTYNSTFIGGGGDKAAIENRIQELADLVENGGLNEVDYENTKTRISQLCAKVATIYVGANSEVESREKRDRIDDALRAAKSAKEEGIVPGGCYSYIKAIGSKEFTKLLKDDGALGIGAKIIAEAVVKPFKKLLENAGLGEFANSYIIKIKRNTSPNYGYNIKTNSFENLIDSGVIDPFKVTRCALQNAASVAGLILTSEAIVAEEQEKTTESSGSSIPSLF